MNLKIVKLKKRDKNWKKLKRLRQFLAIFFLVTKPSSVVQALPLQVKREAIERLPKLYLK